MLATVVVHLATAVVCFANQCHPALIGKTTPVGEFPLIHMRVNEPGYGGDVLAFARSAKGVFAIHRLWLLAPAQHRQERIASEVTADRQAITGGCVNVTPPIYQALVDCCSGATVRIEP